MVEVEDGSIEIDGVDIRHIGLSALRNKLALVPQDSTLFVSCYTSLLIVPNTNLDQVGNPP
jgi:ATP-binding cassette, subfamily C (CFTR/MRP), member 1